MPTEEAAVRIGNRVLVVDDDPQLLTLVRVLVERARPDASVVYARDVQSAEWLMRSTTLRLVLTDLSMDGDPHAGVTVVALARELEIPVAVITANPGALLAKLHELSAVVVAKTELTSPAFAAILDKAFAV